MPVVDDLAISVRPCLKLGLGCQVAGRTGAEKGVEDPGEEESYLAVFREPGVKLEAEAVCCRVSSIDRANANDFSCDVGRSLCELEESSSTHSVYFTTNHCEYLDNFVIVSHGKGSIEQFLDGEGEC